MIRKILVFGFVCAAALATLYVIEEEGLLDHTVTIGKHIYGLFEDLHSKVTEIGDVRGRGMMLAIEFVKPDGAPDAELAKKVIQESADKGLLVIGGGLHANVIRTIPPLIITKDQVEEGMAILTEVIQQAI